MRILNYCRILAVPSLVAAALVTAGFGPAGAGDPTGDWRVADGVANIRVAECNGAMWGVVAWEKKPGGVDQNNPDISKRSRPTLGMPILLDMKKKDEKDEWEGQVYNAKNGKLYDSSIKLESPDQLEIEGCVLGFLCGGETWTRVSGPIPSSPSNNPANTSASGGAKVAPKTGMAKTSPSKTPHKTTGQKTAAAPAAAANPDDPVGDICLLPDIAGAAHERGLK
ncbi:MAG: hypothetical protein NTAFB05_06570 [Nitrobacter sp.]|uniref:DUF2147 domain-containing protein n=1 Tax=Nitrobacter sp. TaxID=29420 RepID=UPI00387DEFB5